MKNTLKNVFGYNSFRVGQEEIVKNILKGRDVLAVMPTGSGKSVCYQLPAVMSDGITIVISPLVSLMSDQVKNLIELGIRGAYLNSTLTQRQYIKALDNAKKGVYKIIYVAPERLENKAFLDFAQNANISILSVDEAHCVSQWGQDFRPSYLKIDEFVKKLKKRPVVCAFTATATPNVKSDISNLLGLKNPFEMETGFDRTNLYFETVQTLDKKSELLRILKNHNNDSGIVYCISRKAVEDICDFLNARGYSAAAYHAGMDSDLRHKNQNDFIYDKVKIMVATNAFGMGIDKPDVRFVVHYNMPSCIENYYQEAGRAGRDGERADCILLYSLQDYYTNKFLIESVEENPDLTQEQIQKIMTNNISKLNQMKYYATNNNCLREYMLYYFGEKYNKKCSNCSNCLKHNIAVEKANSVVDYNLISMLKNLRKDIASKYRVPVSSVFTDGTIREMAIKKPDNKYDMLDIMGMTKFKYNKYGKEFLELIIDYKNGNL